MDYNLFILRPVFLEDKPTFAFRMIG